jgi:hypothetical protein
MLLMALLASIDTGIVCITSLMEKIVEESRNNDANIKSQLYEKEKAIVILTARDSMNVDTIASLSDRMQELMAKVQELEKVRK